MAYLRRSLVVACAIAAAGCSDQPSATTPADPSRNDPILAVAREYESYGRFDGVMRFAPFDCAAPTFDRVDGRTGRPALAVSASSDEETHGRKLYALYVKKLEEDWPWYTPKPGQAVPVGQAIVKEAWVPEEMPPDWKPEPDGRQVRPSAFGRDPAPPHQRFAEKDGKRYRPAEKAGLFIMLKLDPATPDTDQGWVYATVSADGKTVTSSGRVESCMGCHTKAPGDRLFGVGRK